MIIETRWTNAASKVLTGRTIVRVFYMSASDAELSGFFSRPLVIELDDGTCIFPMADDEGNNGGALSTNHGALPTIPVL